MIDNQEELSTDFSYNLLKLDLNSTAAEDQLRPSTRIVLLARWRMACQTSGN